MLERMLRADAGRPQGVRARRVLPMKTFVATSMLLWTLAACTDAHAPSVPDAGSIDSAAARAQQQMQLLRGRLSRSSKGLVLEHRPDGLTRVSLKSGFHSVTVHTADGRITCVDSQAGLDRVLGVEP